jgi:membrane protein required for colicin V production
MSGGGWWDSISSLFRGGPALDLGAALLVFVLFVLGLRRGFVAQAGRLVGLFVGFVLARAFSPTLAPLLAPRLPATRADLPVLVSFLVILLGTFLLVTVLALLLRRALEELKLSSLDRAAGGVLGAATAGVLLTALVLAIAFVVPPANVAAFSKTAWTMRAGLAILDRASAVLPPEARARLDAVEVESGR